MELTEEEVKLAKENIRKMDLFCTCSETELNDLVCGLEKQSYKKGSTILFQGEISSSLCMVGSGKVCVIVRKGTEKNTVAELGPKSYFGEISLLTPRAATATIKAEEDTVIIFLPGEKVQGLVKKNPVLANLITMKINERLGPSKQQGQEK
jgi:CRP-like cAMP-binding protein